MIPVDSLSDEQLNLIFHFAEGFQGFTYYEKLKCWKVERQKEGFRLTTVGIIPDKDCKLTHHPCMMAYQDDPKYLISCMRSENITLAWDDRKRFKLSYAAFPEISAADEDLTRAFKKVFVKKELGDKVEAKILSKVNIAKERVSHEKTVLI